MKKIKFPIIRDEIFCDGHIITDGAAALELKYAIINNELIRKQIQKGQSFYAEIANGHVVGIRDLNKRENKLCIDVEEFLRRAIVNEFQLLSTPLCVRTSSREKSVIADIRRTATRDYFMLIDHRYHSLLKRPVLGYFSWHGKKRLPIILLYHSNENRFIGAVMPMGSADDNNNDPSVALLPYQSLFNAISRRLSKTKAIKELMV